MSKIVVFILLILSRLALADWVDYADSIYGDKHWYNSEKVERMKGEIFIWERTRYPNAFGYKSSLEYKKIDCINNTIQVIEGIFYSDDEWSIEVASLEKPRIEEPIELYSIDDRLKDALCENTSK